MGWKICILLGAAALFWSSCGAKNTAPETAGFENPEGIQKAEGTALDQTALNLSLEEFAEMERSGSFVQGMALAESGLRENAGDYAGAVAAAYKELAWAYGYGFIQRGVLEEGLEKVRDLRETGGKDDAARAAEGILAFMRGRWDEAGQILRSRFDARDEPDGFAQWMLLVCSLETNRDDRQTGSAYRAIRARYGQFPEYWYRGARAFSGTIAAEYAEQCISLAPAGPFAAECRGILALFAGLKQEDGASLRSKREIEDIISRSFNQGNPEILASLLPLISLPDNPYTIYAVGALRALSALPLFREYLNSRSAGSGGRLAERLAYICRG
jgi:hypothetical protein